MKWRFIADCREINQHFPVKNFRLDHMQQIFPALKRGHWGAKIDLKDAYFHVPLHSSLKPFLRHRVGDQVWEYQAGCFGLNVMPQIFMSIMKTFERKWRRAGLQVFIYLDDIFLVSSTKKILQKHLDLAVQDLLDSGFRINIKKSTLEPCQSVTHLGFIVNFAEGKLQLSPPRSRVSEKS